MSMYALLHTREYGYYPDERTEHFSVLVVSRKKSILEPILNELIAFHLKLSEHRNKLEVLDGLVVCAAQANMWSGIAGTAKREEFEKQRADIEAQAPTDFPKYYPVLTDDDDDFQSDEFSIQEVEVL